MITITLILALFLGNLSTQVIAQESNPDSLFLEVQKSAESKNYNLAIGKINLLVSSYPQNIDYAIYLARLYFWSEKFDLAQNQLLNIIEKTPSNEEVFSLLVKIELAAKKSSDLLIHSVKGITLFPNKKEYYSFYKAQALEQLGKDKEALLILNSIKNTSDFYIDAQYIKNQLLKKQKNIISVGYLNTNFGNSSFSPWHFGIIEYMRKTEKNAFVGRVNYGVLFGLTGFQGEIEAYPKTGEKSYLYLNAGLSDGKSVFPIVRLGTEFYKNFNNYSTSLGARYLHFNQSQVTMFTGHLGRNFNSFNISYRPYLLALSNNWFSSHILNFRKTFEEKEAFVQLDLQYGAVPYYFFINEEFLRTSAFRVGFNYRFRVSDNFFIQPIFMFELEEYIPTEFRNRYNTQLILSKRF